MSSLTLSNNLEIFNALKILVTFVVFLVISTVFFLGFFAKDVSAKDVSAKDVLDLDENVLAEDKNVLAEDKKLD